MDHRNIIAANQKLGSVAPGAWEHDQPVCMPPLDEIHDRVNVACKRVWDSVGRYNAMGDRLFGETPEAASTLAGPTPVRSGAIGGIIDRLDELDKALAALDRTANRLSAI